jgi:dTDP-4-amino-4,6-dideoxygalactose transaminase
LGLAALLDPGDEVILSDPRYACYANFIQLCDGVCVDVSVDEAEAFQYTAAQIRPHLTARTKAILIILPPIHRHALAPAEMACIAELGPLVISDEVITAWC